MAYTNSSLVSYTRLSPNHSGLRTHSIDRITPHCVVGQCTVQTLGDIFAPTSRQASCNYGIGKDGKVGMYVEEKNRSWCSSSNANDQRAVTIECASDTTEPYAFKDVVYQTLITLCADICKRNGKTKLLWLGDKEKTLNYTPKSDEMVLTVHRWFANKSCPGNWMYARSWADAGSQKGAFSILENAKKCADANPGYSVFDGKGTKVYPQKTSAPAASANVPFHVQVSITDLNIRKGPGTDYGKTGKFTGKGVFTITEVKSGKGSTAGWGRLKSGAGWISLDYARKI